MLYFMGYHTKTFIFILRVSLRASDAMLTIWGRTGRTLINVGVLRRPAATVKGKICRGTILVRSLEMGIAPSLPWLNEKPSQLMVAQRRRLDPCFHHSRRRQNVCFWVSLLHILSLQATNKQLFYVLWVVFTTIPLKVLPFDQMSPGSRTVPALIGNGKLLWIGFLCPVSAHVPMNINNATAPRGRTRGKRRTDLIRSTHSFGTAVFSHSFYLLSFAIPCFRQSCVGGS
jgi:hypothetical protein